MNIYLALEYSSRKIRNGFVGTIQSKSTQFNQAQICSKFAFLELGRRADNCTDHIQRPPTEISTKPSWLVTSCTHPNAFSRGTVDHGLGHGLATRALGMCRHGDNDTVGVLSFWAQVCWIF